MARSTIREIEARDWRSALRSSLFVMYLWISAVETPCGTGVTMFPCELVYWNLSQFVGRK